MVWLQSRPWPRAPRLCDAGMTNSCPRPGVRSWSPGASGRATQGSSRASQEVLQWPVLRLVKGIERAWCEKAGARQIIWRNSVNLVCSYLGSPLCSAGQDWTVTRLKRVRTLKKWIQTQTSVNECKTNEQKRPNARTSRWNVTFCCNKAPRHNSIYFQLTKKLTMKCLFYKKKLYSKGILKPFQSKCYGRPGLVWN